MICLECVKSQNVAVGGVAFFHGLEGVLSGAFGSHIHLTNTIFKCQSSETFSPCTLELNTYMHVYKIIEPTLSMQ